MFERLEKPGLTLPHPIRNAWRGLLALVLVLTLWSGAAGAQGFTPIGSGVGIRFEQLNWLADDEGVVAVPSSRAGIAELDFDSEAAALLTSPDGAYLNLYASLDGFNYTWVVENLHLQYESLEKLLESNESVEIDLGNEDGTTLSNLTFQVSLTVEPVVEGGTTPPPPGPEPEPEPGVEQGDDTPTPGTFVVRTDYKYLGAPLPGEPVYSSPVTLVDYHVGGLEGGGSGPAFNPGRWQNPAPRVGARPVRRVSTRIPQNRLPRVSEGWMGCAPGGVARSIRYMLDQRGPGGPTAQNIYSNLYFFMQTNVGAWGTSGANMINGKANYAAWAGLGITTNFTMGLNNMAWVMNTLAAGGDIEINLRWNGGGGHVAMVTSITQMSDGSYQITYIDDPRQGDGVAANQAHTIIVAPNGTFRGGWISGFLVETMP